MGDMRTARPILPWVVWGVAAALYAIAIVNRSSLAALGPATQEHFGIDAATLAAFPVIQLVVYAGCQIPVGMLLDRFGSTPIILIGAMLMVIGQTAMATVDNVGLAILARVLVGAGDACSFTAVMRMLPDWFKPRQLPMLGQATGLIGQAGQLVSVTPLAFVVANFGWATGFLGIAAVGLLAALLGFVVLRDAPGRRTMFERMIARTGKITERSAGLANAPVTTQIMAPPATSSIPVVGSQKFTRSGEPRKEDFIARMRRLLSIPGVRLAFWIHFVTPFSSTVFILLWGTPYLTGGLGLSAPAAGGLLSITVISAMAAGFVLGPISSRFVEHRVWLAVGITLLIMGTWITVMLWPGEPPMWLIVAMMIILPIGGPASMIAFEVSRSHTPRSFAGFGTGFVNTGGFIAALVVIYFVGVVLDAQGAGSPSTYSLHAFDLAFAVQIPVWLLGLTMILIERRRTGKWMEQNGRTLR